MPGKASAASSSTDAMAALSWILTFTCADRVGIVAAVAGALAERDGFILDSQQYADLETGRFFMRVAFRAGGPRFPADGAALRAALAPVAERYGFTWTLTDSSERPRMLIAVSKASHCLNDLLHRWRTGALPIDIVGVVSNHDGMRALTEWHGIPYHYLPVGADGLAAQEAAGAAGAAGASGAGAGADAGSADDSVVDAEVVDEGPAEEQK